MSEEKLSDRVDAAVLTGAGIGSTAAYEIGVLRALAQRSDGFDPAIYSGGTFGAINAAFLASPHPGESFTGTLDRLEKLWLDEICEPFEDAENGVYRLRFDPRPFLSPRLLEHPIRPFANLFRDGAEIGESFLRRLLNLINGKGDLEQRLGGLVDLTELFSPRPLRHLVEDNFDFQRLRDSAKHLRVAATNWTDGEVAVFANADMTDDNGPLILLGSTGFLLVFPPVEIDGVDYAGAGASLATPLRPALDAWLQADDLPPHLVAHVVLLDPRVAAIPFGIPSSPSGFSKQVIMQQALSLEPDVAYARRLNADIARAADQAAVIAALEAAGEVEGEALAAVERLRASQVRLDGKRGVSVHFYRPRRYSGAFFELLDFDRDKTRGFIDHGFQDARAHDCDRECCILAT